MSDYIIISDGIFGLRIVIYRSLFKLCKCAWSKYNIVRLQPMSRVLAAIKFTRSADTSKTERIEVEAPNAIVQRLASSARILAASTTLRVGYRYISSLQQRKPHLKCAHLSASANIYVNMSNKITQAS